MPLVTFDNRELMGEGDNASNFIWCKPSANMSAGYITSWTLQTSRGSGFTIDGSYIKCNKSGSIRVTIIADVMGSSSQADKNLHIYKNSNSISVGYEYGAYSACISAQTITNVVAGDTIRINAQGGTVQANYTTLVCEYINEYYLISYASEENSYSTDETKTGGVWIDGKPIYRRVFSGTCGSSGNSTTVDNTTMKIGDVVDTPIRAYGQIAGGPTSYIPIGSYLNSNYYSGVWWTASALSIYYCAACISQKYNLIVEYTKITD